MALVQWLFVMTGMLVVLRTMAGDYTLTFDNALSSSNYAGFYLAGNLGGGGYSLISPFAVSTTSLEIDQANKNGDKIDRDMVTLGVVL
jgi:hypothetical protein